ncbi:hypothetical protein CERSUDRAFT_93851 [Gelatoporia subvermispora B]|uniref:Uncharacterized protein n=1 Tax=Ceriporiopsis subvermispora (strain B) TaxID=914234 RepID=M2PPB1_CERS8|nr:hypothetical protein CERSUDRAFT_93851 [Gelatoporia subvermispora B]
MSDISPSRPSVEDRISFSPAIFTAAQHSAESSSTAWTTKVSTRSMKASATATMLDPQPHPDSADTPLPRSPSPLSSPCPRGATDDGVFRTRVITVARPARRGEDYYEGHRNWGSFSDAYYEGDLYLSPKAEWLTTEQIIELNSGTLDGDFSTFQRGPGLPEVENLPPHEYTVYLTSSPQVCVAHTDVWRSTAGTRPPILRGGLGDLDDDKAVEDTPELRAPEQGDGSPLRHEARRHREMYAGQKTGSGINTRQFIYPTMAYHFAGPHYLLDLATNTNELKDLDPPMAPVPGGIFALSIKTPRFDGLPVDTVVLERIIPMCDILPAACIDKDTPDQGIVTAQTPIETTPLHQQLPPDAQEMMTPPRLPTEPALALKGKSRAHTPLSPSRASPPIIDLTSPTTMEANRLHWRNLKFSRVQPASHGPSRAASERPPARKRVRSSDSAEDPAEDYNMAIEDIVLPTISPRVNRRVNSPGPAARYATPALRLDAALESPHPLAPASGAGAETVNEDFSQHLDELFSTADTTMGTNLTPPLPDGSYPRVHGDDPAFLFNGVPNHIVQEWCKESAEKVIIQIWGYGLGHPSGPMRGEAAIDLLHKHHKITGLKFFLPHRSPHTGIHDEPHSMLVYEMPKELRLDMIRQGVYSAPGITIFVHAFAWCVPTYVKTLSGFALNDTARIRRVLARRLLGADFTNLVTSMRHSHPRLALMSDDDAVADTANSLELRHVLHTGPGGAVYSGWGVFLRPPTTLPRDARVFRKMALEATFGDESVGYGKTVLVRPCSGCHGMDHSRGMCPFTSLPGWNGITPEAQAPIDKAEEAKWKNSNLPWPSIPTRKGRGGSGRGGAPARRGRGRGGRY